MVVSLNINNSGEDNQNQAVVKNMSYSAFIDLFHLYFENRLKITGGKFVK